MGLLKHLLLWPVTGPKFLIDFSLGKVEGVVKEQLTDDSEIKAELLELQLLLELGDIDDDEFVVRETAIMYRLREIREWRERFGMGVSGGPVRVAGSQQIDADDLQEMPVTPVEEETKTPQIASPGEATIEFHLDWE